MNIRLRFNRIIWNIMNDFYSFQEINCIPVWGISQSHPPRTKNSSSVIISVKSRAAERRPQLFPPGVRRGTTWTDQDVSKGCSQTYSLSFCWCACAQSRLSLCDPMDTSPPGSSVHEIFPERILERVAISFSRGSSRPRDRTCISCISCISCTGRWILYHCVTWEALSGRK